MASSGSVRRMNDRPAPRCKRRRYRCAVQAQPIRISTVRYSYAYCLRVSRTRDRKTLDSRHRERNAAIRIAAFYRLSNGIY